MTSSKKIVPLLILFCFLFQPAFSRRVARKKSVSKKQVVKTLPPAPDPGLVGELVYVDGDVSAQRVKAPDWLTAYQNMPDYLLDKVKTGSDAKATLEFKDGTQVGVNKDTEVLIDTNTTVKDVTQRTLLKRVILDVGSIWCKVTKQEADENFTVQTRGGVIGVRGTEFEVTTTGDNKMQVYVLEGTVMAGPSIDQLTQAIPQGNEAVVQDGKVIQMIEYGKTIAHIAFTACGCVPYYAHFGVDIIGGLAEGQDVGGMAANLAVDEALSYVPYGGYVSGFVPGFHFGGPPPQPSELQPQGMVSTYTPVFSWKGLDKAKQYMVMVSKAPIQKDMPKEDWVWLARVDKTTATYPYTATYLVPGATYYWTVVGLDENGKVVGKGGNPVTFTLADQSALGHPNFYPVPLHPMSENEETLFPSFSWNPMEGAHAYTVLISSRLKDNKLDGDFAVANLSSSTTSVAYGLKDRPLAPGQTYYWSVAAMDENGKQFTLPSPPSSFTTPSADRVGPTPVFPVDTAKAGPTLHMEWRGWISPISGYRVVVSKNADLSDPVLTQVTADPWLDVTDATAKFTPGTTYYWAVTSLNLEGKPAGKRGEITSFTLTP